MHKSKIKYNINTLKIGLKEIFSLQPWLIPCALIDAVFKSMAPFINIYMSAKIIDELIGAKNLDKLKFLVVVTISLNLAVHLISAALDHLVTMLRNITMQNQKMKLNEKIVNMNYEQVENPEIHLLRTKIAESENMNGGGISALIEYLADLEKGFFTVVVSIYLVINLFKSEAILDSYLSIINSNIISYGFLILVIVCIGLSLKMQTKSNTLFFNSFSKVMDINRVFGYYFGQILDYNVGKEIRLCNQKEILIKENKDFTQGTQKLFNDLGYKDAKYRGFDGLITSLVSGTIYVFVGLKAIVGAISIGSVVQYTGSISQFMEGSKRFLTSVNAIINNNKYLQLYIDFLNIEDYKYKGTIPVEKRDDDEYEIEFRNVSFKYPGTDIYALKNISIKLDIGERLAIVGMNGSGKTTFIKLLARLYEPNEGEILLNGIDIRKYDYEEYLGLFSIVFQDFKLFSFSLGQNVTASVSFDEENVKEVLSKVGLDKRLSTMINGVQTSLYKEFDEEGVEISGGEAQKIALARALHRNAPIIILDEPTSALDPIAEFEIYTKFNDVVGTKTAFYISHRLSSCRFCDEIAVFDRGRIVQKGKHDELLKNEGGKYYELWQAQAKYYNSEVSA